MRAHQITIRCQNDRDHAKVLRIDGSLPESYIETLAGLLDGTSHYFIHPPGERSPIGKCATCGGHLRSEITIVVEMPKQDRDFRSASRVIQPEPMI